jgi:rare lipoprotein A
MIRVAVAALAGAGAILLALYLAPQPVLAAECAGQAGKASFYAEAHHGKAMANGRAFNMNAMTAASNTLPLGSNARVTAGKRSVVVKITDTGGFGKYGRIIDLSKASFRALAPLSRGVIPVCVTRLR